MANSKNMKVRYLIGLGYCVPVALSVLSAGIVGFNVNTVKNEQQKLDTGVKIEREIADLHRQIEIFSKTTRGYLMEPAPTTLADIRDVQNEIESHLTALDDLIRFDEQRQNLQEAEEAFTALKALNLELIQIAQTQGSEAGIAAWKTQDGLAEAQAVAQVLNDLEDQEHEIVNGSVQDTNTAVNSLLTMVIGSTFLAVLLSAGFGVWIISKIATRIQEAANTIASSSSEIATTIEEEDRTASQQAASVNETTTTMNQLGSSARQSTEQAEAAANAAQQALEAAEGGNKAVEETLSSMSTLKQKVGAIAEQILQLSEQTNQIGSISQLVSDLANQTNMLALNASVEAVRAGEHGKGFAVVAGEIRKLADQSKQSAEKIGGLVAEIQNAINSTVMVTDEGTKTVDSGMEITEKTAESFSHITEAVNNVVMNNQQISLNIHQQASGIQQVLEAMNTLNQGAKETAAGISQTRAGTEQLNTVTQELKHLV
ncbi:MAG: methyl-accepting chemotaxis protein [Halothece sp. Uz-M2-17]|nr:methyl-accepting chemotaxis protein [Halothece sp. Uz-M2-17]